MNTFMSRISAEEAWLPSASDKRGVVRTVTVEGGADGAALATQIPNCRLRQGRRAASTIDARIEYLREQIKALQDLNRR